MRPAATALVGLAALFVALPGPDIASADTRLARETARLAPPLVTRSAWKALPPLPGMTPQMPKGIVLHHTGVAQNAARPLAEKLRGLQLFSQRAERMSPEYVKPAWADVPYHYIIGMDGRIAEARSPLFAGDSNTPYDLADRLQIALEGNFEQETPHPRQLSALADLVAWLQLSWAIPDDRILTHLSLTSVTTCPGTNLMAVLPGVLARASKRRLQQIARHCVRPPGPTFARTYCGR